jgi:dienelactone hydrolase
MASLIPGYEYDIFISYRQKDNKYDGWVTEFVENLKRELESMFKDEVSVYHDINPHDGLLETHDVDESLKKKLKCLVCIPIISRTYCDPKSFAWKHEFEVFIDQAKNDPFGLKVTLPNGNVANRVLPVRIHDLDTADIKLFESAIGGVLRPVDFVYKETGVNRQLRAKDDDIIKSPNQVLYRDQINKVALAVKDIIGSMVSPSAPSKTIATEIPAMEKVGKIDAVHKEKPPAEEEKIKEEISSDKRAQDREIKSTNPLRKTKFLLPVILVVVAFCIAAILFFNHRAKVRWATDEALPGIKKFYEESNNIEAFNLATKAEKYIPDDPGLKDWISKLVSRLTILTDPPGADVYLKEYSDTSATWRLIGKTPIDSIRMPASSCYRLRFEKPEYETVFAVTMTDVDTLSRKLFRQGTVPPGMVYVEEYWDEVKDTYEKDKGFFLDKFEVTNRQYKEFVDKGGYRNRDYWKHEFIKDGKKITWEEAMAEFIDETGRPGPSTWEAGDYPDGQDDHPVSGVSWYEADAYAEYAGKELPTGDHWDSGVGFYNVNAFDLFHPRIYPLSNFNGKGLVGVGKNVGMTAYGALDMAGNVREWCWNETSGGRVVSGGGYADPTYLFTAWDQLPPFDRSPMNGFRCAIYIDRDRIPETAFRRMDFGPVIKRNYSLEIPVPENIFRIYKNQFLYDKKALNAVIEKRDESADDWIMEKVTFDAAYEKQRMIAFLFLPKNNSPPFQTLIFFPGSYAVYSKHFSTAHINAFFDYILKSGRAVVYPIYFRTYERNDDQTSHETNNSHEYTELLIKWVRDFTRTIDYLESRSDIDTGKLGYCGHSWGGRLGAIIPAVEDRLKINILLAGGFPNGKPYPEADEMNYVSRVKIPTLMLNGKYDAIFPLDNNVSHFFRLLGTPETDKRLCILEASHNFPKRYMIREILNWCDKYFGPVK